MATTPASHENCRSRLGLTLPDDVAKHAKLTIQVARHGPESSPRSTRLSGCTPSSPVELGLPANSTLTLCPVDLRGEAYLMLRHGKAAAAEFQTFIDHRGIAGNFPWGGLARAYGPDAAGDKNDASRGKARAAYQAFLTLWKDPDPDLPIPWQGRAEYAKLQ